jgi:hypothetical protein
LLPQEDLGLGVLRGALHIEPEPAHHPHLEARDSVGEDHERAALREALRALETAEQALARTDLPQPCVPAPMPEWRPRAPL